MSVLSVRPDRMGKFSVACDGWAEETASLRPLTYCYGSHGPHTKCIQEKPMYSCFKSSTGASVQQWKWLCSVVQWRAKENRAEPAEGLTGAGPHTREAGGCQHKGSELSWNHAPRAYQQLKKMWANEGQAHRFKGTSPFSIWAERSCIWCFVHHRTQEKPREPYFKRLI